MPELVTENRLQAVWRLPFCYLCGGEFVGRADRTRDHVPNKAIFLPKHRSPPLVLPTHERCNGRRSDQDERIAHLTGILHGNEPPDCTKLRIEEISPPDSSEPFYGLRGIDLQPVIGRWLRGFHAALYEEFLPSDTRNEIIPPLPSGTIDEGRRRTDEPRPTYKAYVEVISKNRIAQRVDRIRCFGGKCLYECVWERLDGGGAPICVFALQIYNWQDLGDPAEGQRGCVGSYRPAACRPAVASRGTQLEFTLPAED